MMGARRYEKRSAAESAAALAVRLMQELAATASRGTDLGRGRPAPVDPLILQ